MEQVAVFKRNHYCSVMIFLALKILFWLIAIPVAALVCYILFNQVKIWRTLSYYKKQGIKTHYHPIYGWFSLLQKKYEQNRNNSNREYLKHLVNSGQVGDGILAANRLASTTATVLLFSPEYIKEFLLKEDNFYKANVAEGVSNSFGFFFENGEKAF